MFMCYPNCPDHQRKRTYHNGKEKEMIVIYLCMISLAKPLKMKKKNGFQKIIIYIYIY